jgi:hypothetical protein
MIKKKNYIQAPSFIKAALTETRPIQLTFRDLIETNIESTSSFYYDPLNYPLKNTQQLNINWSKFEEHTFFQSAEVKTNIAFDQIINGYPFDGTRIEVERFFERLTGFERWIFDQFPKFAGQLHFSGTQVGEDPSNGFSENLGVRIEVKDSEGGLFPELSKKNSGDALLNPPHNKSFTAETHIFVPDQVNDSQIVFQKLSSDKLQGFTFYLHPSLTSYATGTLSIISGSVENFVDCIFPKGKFNHICVSFNRETGNNYLQSFVDERLQQESKKQKVIGALDVSSTFYIGSGSSFYSNGAYVTPQQTFSGTLDEFRIFHSYRTIKQQRAYATKGIYSTDSLKLYFRFNEPSSSLSSDPSDAVNSIALDSSGNSLHGLIYNFNTSLRRSASEDAYSLMKDERPEFKTILFPYNPDVINLNTKLLASASTYDNFNPNLITKLIPRHYLRQGADYESIKKTEIEGTIGNSYGGEGMPGQGKLGSTQIILTFLYIWAKFFDDIKMFVDSFGTLHTIDYETHNSVPDNFLTDLANSYGLYLPPFFNDSSILQYVDGEDIGEQGLSTYTLKQIQSMILRRVLVNIPDVLRSKGTQHSIKSYLRSVGIDPDNTLRIREFGGPSLNQLGASRETRTEYSAVVDFHTTSIVSTSFLSASRVEPGYPEIMGSFVEGVSSNPNDGLLTSGSWTYEACYKYVQKNLDRGASNKKQSLVRFEVTGSSSAVQPGVVLNLFATSSLLAYIRPGDSSTSPLLSLNLPVDIFNGERWNVSVGCFRNDSIESVTSSSYFLRAAVQNNGDITKIYTTSSFFNETPTGGNNVFRTLSALTNASGSRIVIGRNDNIPEGVMGYLFLNNTIDSPDDARETSFVGQISNVRFWSKGLSETEWREHVRNPKSLGVMDALTNYNYVTNKTGSFEKLRLSTLEKQTARTASLSGDIIFNDFSENEISVVGNKFPAQQNIFVNDIFGYSYLSPYFDEYSTSEKIRIRSFKDSENLNDSTYASVGPLYELPPGETPLDDVRLSIEFSLLDALNKDIVNMFATFDTLSTAIGSPELMYSPDYPDLEKLRNIYFNRVKEKISFRNFFEFYRWFDQSMSNFIEQLVPRKTRFKGINFVVESHMLERHKLEYQSSEIYLGDSTRGRIKDNLLVQQVVGKISRF